MDMKQNGFTVSFANTTFTGWMSRMQDTQHLEATREAIGDESFIWGRDGNVYLLPQLALVEPS
jgi:hypothetical protein